MNAAARILAILVALSLAACAAPPTPAAAPTLTASIVPSATPTRTLTPSPTPDPGPWYDIPITVETADRVRQLAIWGKGLPWEPKEAIWFALGKDGRISTGNRVYESLEMGEFWLPEAAHLDPGGNNWVVQTPSAVYLYSAADHTLVATLQDATVYKYSRDGSLIVTGQRNGAVRVWDASDGALMREFSRQLLRPKDLLSVGPQLVPAVGDVDISPDGTLVAAGYADARIVVWRIRDHQALLTLQTGLMTWRVGLRSVAFSPDGKKLLSLSEGGAELWDLRSGERLWTQGAPWWTLGIDTSQPAFSPDGSLMGVIRGGYFWLMDGEGNMVYEYTNSSEGRIRYSISEDWTQLWIDRPERGEREVRSLPDGKLMENVPIPSQAPPFSLFEAGHVWGLAGAKILPDKSILAWGSTNDTVYWWRPEDNTFTSHPKGMLLPYFSADGSLAAKCEGGPITVLGMDGRETQYDIQGHRVCNGLTFSPNGDSFAVWTRTGLDLVSLASGEAQNLVGHSKPIVAAHFSPDGTLLASAESSFPVKIMVWNVQTRERLATLVPDQDQYGYGVVPDYYVLAFSPDNTLLATRGHGNAVHLWDLPQGTLARSIDVSGDLLAFSPNGKILATGNRVGIISLWKASTGQKLAELRGHAHLFERMTGINDYIPTVSFPPDGLYPLSTMQESVADPNLHSLGSLEFLPEAAGLLSVGRDGTIRLWGIDPGQREPAPQPPIPYPILKGLRNGQWLEQYETTLEFRVYPVTGAALYHWRLLQRGKVVLELETTEPELILPKDRERDIAIHRDDLIIYVSAQVNGEWTDEGGIVVHLK